MRKTKIVPKQGLTDQDMIQVTKLVQRANDQQRTKLEALIQVQKSDNEKTTEKPTVTP